MSMKLSIKADIEELLIKRRLICEIVKENGFFGADYTNKYIWDKEDHPYKNLCNYILWCEHWIQKIKISNNRQKIMPKIRTAELLKVNEDLEKHVLSANILAQKIRDDILGDNVDLSDIELGLKQYHSEQKLFEAITPNVEFLRPKLELLYEIITQMPEVIEKNRMIMEDFKNCFKGNNLTLKKLKSNLYELSDKYGFGELNKYAKTAWYFYEKFGIPEILEEMSKVLEKRIIVEKKLRIWANVNQDLIDKFSLNYDGFLEWIDSYFFTEINIQFNLYEETNQVLKDILITNVKDWDICLFELIIKPYKFMYVYRRAKLQYWDDKLGGGCSLPRKQKATQSENERTKEGYGDLIWRIATLGCELKHEDIEIIELSQRNKWQLFSYKLIYLLKVCYLDMTKQANVEDQTNSFVIAVLDNYINHKDVASIYKLMLFFIDKSKIDELDNSMKNVANLINEYRDFILTPIEDNLLEFLANKEIEYQ
jgi:hypothetical protein